MSVNKVVYGGRTIIDISDSTVASELLKEGATAYAKTGEKIVGSMPNNGAINTTIDGVNTKSVTIAAGYTSGGTVALDDTIDDEVDVQAGLIAQIMEKANTLPNAGGGGGMSTAQFTVRLVNVSSSTLVYLDADQYGQFEPIMEDMTVTMTVPSIVFIKSGSDVSQISFTGDASNIMHVNKNYMLAEVWGDATVTLMAAGGTA